jgi:hypothetical protein
MTFLRAPQPLTRGDGPGLDLEIYDASVVVLDDVGTSSPSRVRKCPYSATLLHHDACFSNSPTTKDSSRCPYSVKGDGLWALMLFGLTALTTEVVWF